MTEKELLSVFSAKIDKVINEYVDEIKSKNFKNYESAFSLIEKHRQHLISDHLNVITSIVKENNIDLSVKILDPIAKSYIPMSMFIGQKCFVIMAQKHTEFNAKIIPLLEGLPQN